MSRLSIAAGWIGIVAVLLASGCCGPQMCGNGGPPQVCGKGKGGCRPGLLQCMVGGLSRLRPCHGGCGEVYWSEWFSDPPDACDPCDWGGCYTGPNCCDKGIVHLPRKGFASGGGQIMQKLNGGRFANNDPAPIDGAPNIHGDGPILAKAMPAVPQETAAPRETVVPMETTVASEVEDEAANVHWAAWPTSNRR